MGTAPTIEKNAITGLLGDAGMGNFIAAPSREPVDNDFDYSGALTQANDLLLQACMTRDAAYNHLAENPEDAEDAESAVALARKAVAEITAAKSAGRGASPSTVTQILSALETTVHTTATTVSSHEAGSSSSTNKRTLLHLTSESTPAKRRAAAAAAAPCLSARRAYAPSPRAHDDDDDDIVSTARRKAGQAYRSVTGVAVGAWGVVTDSVDDAVDAGRSLVRKGKKMAGAVVRDTREWIDDRVEDTGELIEGGTRWVSARGRDLKRAAGEAGEWVDDTVDGASRQAAELARQADEMRRDALRRAGRARDDAGSASADLWAKRDKFGRQIDSVLGVMSAHRGIVLMGDKDGDGKLELNEARSLLEGKGIKGMRDIDTNQDGAISVAEMNAALRKAGLLRA